MSRLGAHTVSLASAEPAPERKGVFVHLLPAGTFTGRDGRGPYTLIDPDAVIEASRREAGKVQLVVDFEHQIDKPPSGGGPIPAAGWITGMEARENGVWGLVEWTARAAAHIAAREYRYLSPVFRHRKDGTIVSLVRAALTNNPNLDTLTALANAEEARMDLVAQLRKLLGLPEDADEADILAAFKDIVTARHSAAPDPSRFVPIGDLERVNGELQQLRANTAMQTAEAKVTEAIRAGKMTPALRDWGIALCSASPEAFEGFIEKMPAAFAYLAREHLPGGKVPGPVRPVLSETQIAIAARLGVSEEDYAKQTKD